MSNKLNIGLIGAGMIGDVHIENIRKDGRAEVTWIAARTQGTLQAQMKKHQIDQGTLDYRELLNDRSLDAVIIASPPHTHLAILKDALAAGKHVLLEKPMVPNRQELEQLIAEVEKTSAFIGAGMLLSPCTAAAQISFHQTDDRCWQTGRSLPHPSQPSDARDVHRIQSSGLLGASKEAFRRRAIHRLGRL